MKHKSSISKPSMGKTHKPKQNGAALIAVMVIVFLVMTIISNITIRNFRIISRLTNQNVQQQSTAMLVVGTNFGRAGLGTSAATSKIDTINDIWAQPLPKTKIIGDFFVSGYITDEQSKFNINDLVINGNLNPPVVAQFTQLLDYLKIPTSLASSIALYMASPANQSNIMSAYSSGDAPSRPAGRPLIDLSELTLVKGMQNNWLYKLQQYVTVIPQKVNFQALNESPAESSPTESGTESAPPAQSSQAESNSGTVQVNVNTASAEVIAAKSGIPLPIAQRMVAQRNNTAFNSQKDITTFLSTSGIILSQEASGSTPKVDPSTLTTQSSYFTIHAITDKDDFQFTLVSFVYRADRSGQWPKVLWQHPE